MLTLTQIKRLKEIVILNTFHKQIKFGNASILQWSINQYRENIGK